MTISGQETSLLRRQEQSGFRPELLLPAGNLEKLKVALLYGATAVYVGGQRFGLRSRADNFTEDDLREGTRLAHSRGAGIYVVLNAFLHDADLKELPSFVRFLETIGVDAVIVSDLGVLMTVREHSQIPIHLSTQASCLNIPSARLWKNMGAKRLIVGRELSIREAGQIKREVGIEVEMFVHGSMCMAYSGNCTISNYTSGRDSNRGGCAHSCRFEYQLDFSGKGTAGASSVRAPFMSSKDLQGPRLLPYFFEEEIDSLKIEGRMKSHLYVGTASKVYSEAIKAFSLFGFYEEGQMNLWEEELQKVTRRGATTGSLLHKAGADSVEGDEKGEEEEFVLVGKVLESHPGEFLVVEVKGAFSPGEELELVPFEGPCLSLRPPVIWSMAGQELVKTSPNSLVKLPPVPVALPYQILRKKRGEGSPR